MQRNRRQADRHKACEATRTINIEPSHHRQTPQELNRRDHTTNARPTLLIQAGRDRRRYDDEVHTPAQSTRQAAPPRTHGRAVPHRCPWVVMVDGRRRRHSADVGVARCHIYIDNLHWLAAKEPCKVSVAAARPRRGAGSATRRRLRGSRLPNAAGQGLYVHTRNPPLGGGDACSLALSSSLVQSRRRRNRGPPRGDRGRPARSDALHRRLVLLLRAAQPTGGGGSRGRRLPLAVGAVRAAR